MPKKSISFTESYIKGLPIPESGDYSYSDRGLRLRVYPSGAKKWSYFKHAPNGVRKTVAIGEYPSVSLKQARAIADKRLGDMIKEGHEIESSKAGVTFGEYIHSNSYLSWSKINRKSHKEIMNNLQNIVPVWFHKKSLNVFDNNDFQKFVDERLKEGIKEQTINRNLNNIRSVFKHAFNQNVIKENPMVRFKQLKVTQVKEKLSLKKDERARLIETARDLTQPQAFKRRYMEFFIELGLYTGLRKSELTSLRWKHFNCDDLQTIDFPSDAFGDKQKRLYQCTNSTITKLSFGSEKASKDLPVEIDYKEKGLLRWYIEVEGTYTKSGKNRTVPVPTHLIERLREYLWNRELKSIIKQIPDCAFPDHNLNVVCISGPTVMGAFDEVKIIPVQDPKKAFATIHKLAGLPKDISIHTMRHEFCSDLIRQGIDIYTVQRLAGHQDIRTTMRYVHGLDSKDFSALHKLEHNLLN